MEKNSLSLVVAGCVTVLFIAMIAFILVPLLFIWSTNFLFGTDIPQFSWSSWIASLVFLWCMRGGWQIKPSYNKEE